MMKCSMPLSQYRICITTVVDADLTLMHSHDLTMTARGHQKTYWYIRESTAVYRFINSPKGRKTHEKKICLLLLFYKFISTT